MRHVFALFALSLLCGPLASQPARAADARSFQCPPQARSVVTHTGQPEWYATNQSSEVQTARIGVIGGTVKLICVYEMFGGEYWIHRDMESGYGNCRVMRNALDYSFYCLRG